MLPRFICLFFYFILPCLRSRRRYVNFLSKSMHVELSVRTSVVSLPFLKIEQVARLF